MPSPADQSVRLSWSPVEGASGYKVKYGTVGGPLSSTVDAGPLTAYRVTTLTNGKKYRFAVVSYNETGEGQPSNGMEAVPGHQTLWESS